MMSTGDYETLSLINIVHIFPLLTQFSKKNSFDTICAALPVTREQPARVRRSERSCESEAVREPVRAGDKNLWDWWNGSSSEKLRGPLYGSDRPGPGGLHRQHQCFIRGKEMPIADRVISPGGMVAAAYSTHTRTNSCYLILVKEVQSSFCKHLSAIASLVQPSSPGPSGSARPLTLSWRKSNCDFLPKTSTDFNYLTTTSKGGKDLTPAVYG